MYVPYRAVNTHPLGYKISQLIFCREIIAVFFLSPHKTRKYTVRAERGICEC